MKTIYEAFYLVRFALLGWLIVFAVTALGIPTTLFFWASELSVPFFFLGLGLLINWLNSKH